MKNKLNFQHVIDDLAKKVTNPQFKVNLGFADAVIYVNVLKVLLFLMYLEYCLCQYFKRLH